ncbi:hypothetical protein ACP70R_005869 [Stipagrostis hirtigluma subsp. patula]
MSCGGDTSLLRCLKVTVAIYVFCKSWRGSDKRLLQTAILLFLVGVFKCLDKPIALKRASINSLVSSSEFTRKTTNEEGKVNSLEDYVQRARALLQDTPSQQGGEINSGQDHVQGARDSVQDDDVRQEKEIRETQAHGEPYKLFVDLASSYPDRLRILKSFWGFDENQIYDSLLLQLSDTFSLLYTKIKMSVNLGEVPAGDNVPQDPPTWAPVIRILSLMLPFAAIGLFHHSHRKDYNDMDVMITYIVICCTAALEFYSNISVGVFRYFDVMVSQYNLIGFFVRNKNHSSKMFIAGLFGCKDFVDQCWCRKSSSSAPRITKLVLQHVKHGWTDYIQDAASYRKFNDYRGQWTLEDKKCDQELGWSLKRPFDESVLLWHIATDFCFYLSRFQEHQCAFAVETSDKLLRRLLPWSLIWKRMEWEGGHRSDQYRSQCGALTCCKAVQCRQMSNYMMYLMFINPEMLLPGARRNLFTTANSELEELLKGKEPPQNEEGLIQEIENKFLKGNKPPSNEEGLIQEINDMIGSEGNQGNFISDAWALSQALLGLGDEKKMWEVIEGVWVEMLCFSAGRCRGYLHAKALGTGGEFLTIVWLLLSNMGMETLAERMQRTVFPDEGGDTDKDPSSSHDRTGATSSTSEVSNSAATPTSKVHTAAASSTSEIPETRNVAGDEMV